MVENRHLLEERGLCAFCAANLTDEELWNVVFYAATLRTSSENVAAGGRLYGKHCLSCHGEQGEGKQPLRRLTLLGRAVNTSDAELEAEVASEHHVRRLSGAILSPAERQQVVDYLRSIVFGETPRRPETNSPLAALALAAVAAAITAAAKAWKRKR
ncbi:MAG: cytochrome c [Halobacteria archaeon]